MRSFGSGNQVKLPGSAADSPNVYDFDTPYEEMYQDLSRKDKALYPHYLYSLHSSCYAPLPIIARGVDFVL